ncbi:MAG: amino acid-binding protein [Candidatus Aminicenantes bacterium]|jgi:hypothetical protein|nr:amino acid-binding protein [Candidatus Aminicenantes bacterium]
MGQNLTLLPGRLMICRLGPEAAVPAWSHRGAVQSITRTSEELSIVCAETDVPDDTKAERGWRSFKVEGPLDLSLTGILASLAGPLADARVNIFAISTFDTDYLLVKEDMVVKAAEVLIRSGHRVSGR